MNNAQTHLKMGYVWTIWSGRRLRWFTVWL
ncbi:Uncharacterised protein [Klebsiella oxytoca]|nr:Uncharacterised protein [Klebsiella oxytoca]